MVNITKAQRNDLAFIEQANPILLTDKRQHGAIEDALHEGNCYLACTTTSLVGYAVFDHRFFGYGFISTLWGLPGENFVAIQRSLLSHILALSRSPRVFACVPEGDSQQGNLLNSLGFQTSGVLYNVELHPLLLMVRELDPYG